MGAYITKLERQAHYKSAAIWNTDRKASAARLTANAPSATMPGATRQIAIGLRVGTVPGSKAEKDFADRR